MSILPYPELQKSNSDLPKGEVNLEVGHRPNAYGRASGN